MSTNAAALQRELHELREENAALLEALRLAQRGGADLRGHLSKWNRDAGQQGIFAQDWELRYFVLSGTLLKYYNSERDVGYDPRGVLELQDCTVELELPVKSAGPFIFQVADPEGEMLLRLSADRLETAKAWVRALQAAGLYVHHLQRFNVHQGSGFDGSPDSGLMASHKSAPHRFGEWMGDPVEYQQQHAGVGGSAAAADQDGAGGLGLRQRLYSLGRALSFRPQSTSDSMDSDISVMRVRQQGAASKPPAGPAAAAAAGKRLAGTSDDSASSAAAEPKVELGRPATYHGGDSVGETVQEQQQQQQQEQQGLPSGRGSMNLQHLKRMLLRTQSSKRWVVGGDSADDNDEVGDTEVTTHLSLDDAVQPQLSAAGSTTGATPLSTQTSTSGLPSGPEAGLTSAAAAAAAAAGDAATAAAADAAAVAGGNKAGGSTRPRRQQLDGASAVHVVVKDSVLTWQDDWRISRHEGLLNLGVVVLLATNIRLIMSNIFTYGWQAKVDPASMQAALRGLSSPDDAITWAAVLGCMLFYAAALAVERLGVALLQSEARMRSGVAKKELPAAAATRQLAAAAGTHEWLLFLLNFVNVGASLLLPCCMVLWNKSTLLPASALTMVSIVTCMKLASYAHCNYTLRRQARKKAAADAAAAAAAAATPLNNPALAAALADAPAATTDTPFAYIAASEIRNQTSKPGSESGFPASGFITYPQNLNPADVAYYMLAPTLTYQLNFPRMKRRRVRLLRRWMLLLLGTLLLISFMQVQFLLPLMQSSLMPLHETNLLRFTERLLRLSVPNVAHWLVMFYLVFHLWLNILGELLMFGDRLFYKEWWNAATLGDYWRLWNIPVHKWMLRTVFFPLMRRRVGKFPAMLLVFFLSAVMHELAVAVPLRMLRGWAFWGMLMQVPLVSLTEMLRKRLKSDTLGNMIFWASFCVLGQPMCLILYYHDYVLANMGVQGLAKAAAAGAGAAASAAVEGVSHVVAAAAAR